MRFWILIAMLFWSGTVKASQETHGGNGFIAEFFSIYDSLIQPSARFCYKLLPREGAEFNELAALRTRLEVQSQPTVSLNGKFVDAINQPTRNPKLVVLSEDRWKRSTDSQKKALVLHELIHLLGYRDESPSYLHSSPVLNCLKTSNGPVPFRDPLQDSELCQLMKIKLIEDSYPDAPTWEDQQTLIVFCGPDWDA